MSGMHNYNFCNYQYRGCHFRGYGFRSFRFCNFRFRNFRFRNFRFHDCRFRDFRCLILLVLLLGIAVTGHAAPGDILFEEQFNNNGDFNADWTSSGGDARVNAQTFNSAPRALRIGSGAMTATTDAGIINANVPSADYSVWIRRGSDTFSENPDANEDLVVEYLNDSGLWVALATYQGNGPPGEIITPTFNLPVDALHSGLRLRFRITAGNNGFDFWHIDDVVVTEGSAVVCDTYRDQFNSVSYTNSNGTLDWSTQAWIEQDSNGGGSGGGRVFINGGSLLLRGNNTTNNNHIVRQADTSGSSQVSLSFDFNAYGGLEPDDVVLIEVSSNGGGSFTVIDTLTGFSGSITDSRNYDISAFASAAMQVRIAIGPDDNSSDCCYGGGGETFAVDNLQIEVCPLPTLIGEWQLEEFSWNGSAGEVIDSSGNNLHGTATAVGGIYPSTAGNVPAIPGNPGTCRYGVFNGTAAGAVQIDDDPLLDIADQLTVTAWVNPESLPSSGLRTIVSKDNNFEFHIDNNGQIFWWWGGGSNQLRSTGTALPVSTWSHIAITYISGTQKIYINGIERASGVDTGALPVNNSPLFIGTDVGFNTRNFLGLIDEVRVYDQALTQANVQTIMAETHPCVTGPVFDHFAIDVGPGNASTCAPLSVTVTAEDSSNNTITNYSGLVSLSVSTSHGRWQSTGIAADALGLLTPSGNDDGGASYQFEASGLDNGDITLLLNNSHAETLVVTVTDTASGNSSVSQPVVFSENAFVVTNTDSLGSDLVAGRDHSFTLAMMRRDPGTGDCGPAADYNTADIKVWLTRDSADPSGILPAVRSASETRSVPASEPVTVNWTLPFVNGEADFELLTSDVGKYRLTVKDDSLTFSDSPINGNSALFIVRPFGFDLQVSGNPGAVNASGPVFTTAGDNFSVSARAVLWSGADDVDDNGVPDGHEDLNPATFSSLADNVSAPAFGQESPAEALRLNAYLLQPAGGTDPGLGDGDSSVNDARLLSAFSAGSSSTSQVYYAEVGVIEVTGLSADGDYLGAGSSRTALMRSVSGYTGRFTPARFQLLENDLLGTTIIQSHINAACGTFSYMEQPFSATYYLAALNSRDSVTENYRGAFAKLSGADSFSFGARDQSAALDLSSRVVHLGSVADWAADVTGDTLIDYGYAEIVSALQISRAAVPDGVFSSVAIGSRVVETEDGTTFTLGLDLDVNADGSPDFMLIDETPTDIQFGRLRLADAFGPEAADLPVTFVTQSWDGSRFVTNTFDTCTALPGAAVSYPGGSLDNPANLNVAVGGGTTSGNYAGFGAGLIQFIGGDAGHFFSAPGAGNTGSFSVDVNISLYPWLQYDWDQDGNYFEPALPTATYSFGSYRGHDRIIYWQEVFSQ